MPWSILTFFQREYMFLHIDADPDLAFHIDAGPDPNPDPILNFTHVEKSEN
jgi:hypothetical protein